MKKEEYEKYIKPSSDRKHSVFNHLIVVTPKFIELMEKHGKYCKKCNIPFIPQPYYHKNYPRETHYPTEKFCGFCIYDMNSSEHSTILEEDQVYSDTSGGEII